jgi:hypothetical protein
MASYSAKIISDEMQTSVDNNSLLTSKQHLHAPAEVMDTWICSRARFLSNDDCIFVPISMIEMLASCEFNTDAHRAIRNILGVITKPGNSEFYNQTTVFTVIHWSKEDTQDVYQEANTESGFGLQAIIAMNDASSTAIILQDSEERVPLDFMNLEATTGIDGLLAVAINKTWNLASHAFGWRRVETEVDPMAAVGPILGLRECWRSSVGSNPTGTCSHSISVLHIASLALEYGICFDVDNIGTDQGCISLGSRALPCLHALQREMLLSSRNHVLSVIDRHGSSLSHVYDAVYQLAHVGERPSFPSESFRPRTSKLRRLEIHIRQEMFSCSSCVSYETSYPTHQRLAESASKSKSQYRKEQLSEVRTPTIPTDSIKRPKVDSLVVLKSLVQQQDELNTQTGADKMDIDMAEESYYSDTDSESESSILEIQGEEIIKSGSDKDNDPTEGRLAIENPLLHISGYLSRRNGDHNMEELNCIVLPDQGWRLHDHWFRGFLSPSPRYANEHLTTPGRHREDFCYGLYQSRNDNSINIRDVTLKQLNSLPPRASATGHDEGLDLRLNIESDGPISGGLAYEASLYISGDIDSAIYVGSKLPIKLDHSMTLNMSPTYARRIPFQTKNNVIITLVSPHEKKPREFDLSQIPFTVISKMGASKAPVWIYLGFPRLVTARPDQASRLHYQTSLGNPTLQLLWNKIIIPSAERVSSPMLKQMLPQDISHGTTRQAKSQSIASHVIPGKSIAKFTEEMQQIVSSMP